MPNSLRRIFNPTPKEELELLKKAITAHDEAKADKRCSTCSKWIPPPDDLQGFVEDHGQCYDGYAVDLIKDCQGYIQADIPPGILIIIERIKELERIVKENESH